MTSNDEKLEKSSPTQETSNIDNKLEELSCPFNWGMENVIEMRNKLLDANENRFEMVVDVQEHFPQFVPIYHLSLAYENFMINDLPASMECIDEAEKSLDDLKKKESLKNVDNVLHHIFAATKCHVLQKLGKPKEVEELLGGIPSVDDMNETELAMLNGCECLSWMLYYATDNLEAIKCAEKAIEHEPSNGNWYFLLGKNYRRLRRRHKSIGVKPSQEEISGFEKAFCLSENVLFGVSLAQMYRESQNRYKAEEIYTKVYNLEPTCCKVRLQLALGFIRAKKYWLAKNCLDYVAAKMPNSVIYDHYKAIYEEKCNKDFKAALPYYKSTTENSNFVAEWQYIECRKKVEPKWDPLPYMLGLLDKYDKDTDHVRQGINIQIGAYYLFELMDVVSACPYLITAIEIKADSILLTDHMQLFQWFTKVNIYQALTKEVEFALRNAGKYKDKEITVLENALEACRAKANYSSSPTSQFSNNQKSYSRGTSSRAGINVRQERSGSSFRGFPRNHPGQSSRDPTNEPQRTREHQGDGNLPNPNKNNARDSVPLNRTRGRGARQPTSARPSPRSQDEEADAACCLVKTLKDMNI